MSFFYTYYIVFFPGPGGGWAFNSVVYYLSYMYFIADGEG